ncbi:MULTISPECIES: hypothetical protein [Novosphingobium]|uniref:Membrane-anchored ribosome-binding protein, inhibits growth in stationary phase, ElaB/YqjD/DUF883 family n=1 Tax=Novosphingobium mathurense TaxID=428990 RepID=A0A1U6GWH3_9SPHN|nr:MULTISPECIES: hypothetical protein [Novosphingobium]CDO36406.1 conserved hypothetical protein [Novosphingobium sp. KN65.2]SLJ87861.1 hypothetical protein SAMN06295987_101693 [Novosphingobium mathurense]
MAEPTATTGNEAESARNHFAKAMEEAKAGAQALGKEAQARAEEYRGKLTQATNEWSSEAKTRSDEARTKANDYAAEAREKASAYAADAKVKAADLANEGKARTSQAMVGLSKMIDENVHLIDEKVGPKYGDYARTASKSMQDAATKLDEKSLDDLGEDAKEFVRTSPGLAVGMAVAAGFLFGRMFKKSK